MAKAQQVPARRPALTLRGLVEVGGLFMCAATLAAFFGRVWWVLELLTHFRVHLAATLAVLAAIWCMMRRWPTAAACGACAAVNALVMASLQWPPAAAPLAPGARLPLTAINVNTANERSDKVLDFLRPADSDVIVLMEVNERWMRDLLPLAATHTNLIVETREDNFGDALFSRLPLTNQSVVVLGSAALPSIAATLIVAGQEVFLLCTHPLPPGTAQYARLRNEQIREIAAAARNRSGPVVVLGDLNVTPLSPYFSQLLLESGLKDSSRGHCLAGTWPASLPIGHILPDHCLISPSIQFAGRRLGSPVGGDHLPLVVELLIPHIAGVRSRLLQAEKPREFTRASLLPGPARVAD